MGSTVPLLVLRDIVTSIITRHYGLIKIKRHLIAIHPSSPPVDTFTKIWFGKPRNRKERKKKKKKEKKKEKKKINVKQDQNKAIKNLQL
ncbi:hypothetical protein L873DRAFT_1802223, partial [Choiromyces venosus 120613-1]